jgi:hypothetical protein
VGTGHMQEGLSARDGAATGDCVLTLVRLELVKSVQQGASQALR